MKMMKFIFVILITGFWGVDRISMTEVRFFIKIDPQPTLALPRNRSRVYGTLKTSKRSSRLLHLPKT